jgi:hypothetical protein
MLIIFLKMDNFTLFQKDAFLGISLCLLRERMIKSFIFYLPNNKDANTSDLFLASQVFYFSGLFNQVIVFGERDFHAIKVPV